MGTKKETGTGQTELLPYYDKLIATNKTIIRKGATIPYTSLNGHMFSFISKNGDFALRLPGEVREEFLKKYKTSLHKAYGIVQKEYVVVPAGLLKKTKELEPYFNMSYQYVKSLKPKPSKKKVR